MEDVEMSRKSSSARRKAAPDPTTSAQAEPEEFPPEAVKLYRIPDGMMVSVHHVGDIFVIRLKPAK